MIEIYDNSLQILVLLICGIIAVYRAVKYDSRIWTMLAFFYGSWALGDIYWVFCIVFFDGKPTVTAVSDIGWYTAFLFLYVLFNQLAPLEKGWHKRIFPWLGPLFAGTMMIYFMQDGSILSNLMSGILISMVLHTCLIRVSDRKHFNSVFYLCILTLILFLLEYALWLIPWSKFGDFIYNPYYWVDVLITICFVFYIPALKKAVTA